MGSLAYLILMIVKNRVLEVIRSPRKLIVYLLIIAAIIGIFGVSLFTRTEVEDAGDFLDLIWLKGIFFALALFFFILSISKGLKKGDTIFGMNDVNILFVSPVNPRSILLYGVIRMMGMAFLMGFFILFQGNALGMWFGLYLGDIFIIFLMFIFAVCIMQIVSLLIYSLTNSNPKGKMLARLLATIIFLPMLAYGIWQAIGHGGDIMAALESLLRSPAASWIPIVGWSASATFAFLSGEILMGLMFIGVMLVFGGVLVAAIMLSNPDYYEDVLVATETAFEKQRSKEEGGMSEEGSAASLKKVFKKPIQGSGASVIFYKHLRESFRANLLGIWDIWSIIFVVVIIAVAIIIRLNDGGPGNMAILLQSFMWAKLFMIGMGRGINELSSHHIYMIPSSAFSKLVWNNSESVLKATVESFVMFTTAGIILGASPLLILATVLAYVTYTLMLIGIWYLMLRWTGLIANQGVLIVIYMAVVLIFILPGLIPAIIVGTREGVWYTAVGTGILALWQAIAAIGCFWLSKGIIHNCDMPSTKLWK